MHTDDENEAYILLMLSDSNLPTGSFVASSGLESYLKHGFPSGGSSNAASKSAAITTFIRDSLATYARSALAFVSDAHIVAQKLAADNMDDVESKLRALDDLYDAMTLHHVARRASKSQGVALLTLYTRGFAAPEPAMHSPFSALVDRFKLLVRREEAHGHLPVCWGILTASLGLSLGALHI